MTFRQTLLLIGLLLSLRVEAWAQEPAFYNGDLFGSKPAVRYEEAKGVFHYVVPCKQYASKGSMALETAICWPVAARRLRMIDGKLDFSDFIPGILTISATQVRFIPEVAKDMPFWNSISVGEVRLTDDPSKITRYLESKEIGYKFAFRNYCEECDKTAGAADPTKDAQLIAEFQMVSESLTHFDQVYGRITEMARSVRFIVAPRNQPTLSDPHAAMRLYGGLNQGLAAACPAAVRPCFLEYAKYQTCEGVRSGTECGAPPSCSVTCALTPEALKSLHATECLGGPIASATLIPSWIEVLKQEDADHAAKGDARPASKIPLGVVGGMGGFGMNGSWIPQPGWGSLAAMGTSVPTIIDGFVFAQPEKSCSVRQIYERLEGFATSAR